MLSIIPKGSAFSTLPFGPHHVRRQSCLPGLQKQRDVLEEGRSGVGRPAGRCWGRACVDVALGHVTKGLLGTEAQPHGQQRETIDTAASLLRIERLARAHLMTLHSSLRGAACDAARKYTTGHWSYSYRQAESPLLFQCNGVPSLCSHLSEVTNSTASSWKIWYNIFQTIRARSFATGETFVQNFKDYWWQSWRI